jgi:hypothetical protein
VTVAGGLVVIAIGLLVAFAGLRELAGYLRARRRLRRTGGVVVGHVDAVGGYAGGTSTTMRSARLRFATRTGEVIESVSSARSSRPPPVGTHVPVVYDPADPAGTADTTGTAAFKVALSPLLILGGLAFAAFGVTQLAVS